MEKKSREYCQLWESRIEWEMWEWGLDRASTCANVIVRVAVRRGEGHLKRHFNSESDKKTSPTNLFGITFHDILKFQHICSKRQLKRFLMKLFLVVQSFLIKFCLFWLYDSLCFFYFSPILAIFHDHLQSDTIYGPTPGALMDARDAPWSTPLAVCVLRACMRFFLHADLFGYILRITVA